MNPEEEGLPFDRLKLAGSVRYRIVHAKQFLDSPALKISGTGRYDILADEFDMVLRSVRWGPIRDLETHSLFGQLLSGRPAGV
ncbi:MAG: hypothetical protein KF848_09225 [Nitrospira sp.]|nr:hypothetical protein [Nitrospira sp.]